MKVVFLHLSDMHFKTNDDISDEHVSKIAESLKIFKTNISSIFIIITGDLTSSGGEEQFSCARKFVGALIRNIKLIHKKCECHVLPVPGNHDVQHNSSILDIGALRNGEFSLIQENEHAKLKHFYSFAALNKCFTDNNPYQYIRYFSLNGYKIRVNLVNNAIFSSTENEYKGLLYIDEDSIRKLKCSSDVNFVATVMHHPPDYYRDEIGCLIEKHVIGNSSVFFHGHKHHNTYQTTSYKGSPLVTIQSGGSLCNYGNWDTSSYIVGILDIESNDYKHKEFLWNSTSNQYEYSQPLTMSLSNKLYSTKPILDEFQALIYDDDYRKDYFVFPTISLNAQTPDKTKQIDQLDAFMEEVSHYGKVIITGTSNIGKSTLLKKMFEKLSVDKNVLFCSPEIILNKSKNKQRNIDKLIKELYEDTYGENDSDWQSFEQSDKNECVFIFDDFDQAEDIDAIEFMRKLSNRFGLIILSSSQIVDFSFSRVFTEDGDDFVKFKIDPPTGKKRRQLVEAVISKIADDKSNVSISNIVNQVDQVLKSHISLIPPEPFFIIQCAETFINSVGDPVNSSINVFSKVFEASITGSIDVAIKTLKKRRITVDLMFFLLGKIAYRIHSNKLYPIDRRNIDDVIYNYNDEYGTNLVTEDVLDIVKKAKILHISENNSESYRFGNKSILAYFVAKAIIGNFRDTGDNSDIKDIINKSSINICADILLFIIFLTDNVSIIDEILMFIDKIVEKDALTEFNIPYLMPEFLRDISFESVETIIPDIETEAKHLEEREKKDEMKIVEDFRIKDVYDWDEAEFEQFTNKLIRMTSLLHIVSKSLPCFEHRLKKDAKKRLVECLYRLPNMIFMFWAKAVDEFYVDTIEDLKLRSYLPSKKQKSNYLKQLDEKTRMRFSMNALSLLLNLYYIPVINAAYRNTYAYLTDTDFFDFTQSSTVSAKP